MREMSGIPETMVFSIFTTSAGLYRLAASLLRLVSE
jgi:hypothetical protein